MLETRNPQGTLPRAFRLQVGLDGLVAVAGFAICAVLLVAPPGPLGVRVLGTVGIVVGWVGLRRLKALKDDLRMARAEKRQAETEAAAAGHVRSDLLAGLTHELRAPIHAVSGLAELSLAEAPESDPVRARLELIRKASQRQLRLVDDILDFACLESGTLGIEPAAFSPGELTAECVELLLPKAEDRGLQLTWTALPSVPARVFGDGDRWRQVLVNLIDNGVKYTRWGGVDVRLDVLGDVAGDGAGARLLRCRVRDTGVGLRATDRRRLFEPFARADTTLARTSAGVGLGLAICRRLVELMGGELGCESERGKGSTFWFTLPLQTSTCTEIAGGADKGAANDLVAVSGLRFTTGTSVLVVDDDPASRLVARGFLNSLGCQVGEASNGARALEKLRSERWDLVLLDGRMPELDGEQTVAELRRRLADAESRPTVIAVGADSTPGERERRLALGFDDDLPKPFNQQTLATALSRWLPTVEEGFAAEPAEVFHLPSVLAGHETLAALWRLGLHTGDDELGRAVSAFENVAYRSLRTLRSSGVASIGAAHDLAGSAGILGLTEVGELAAELVEGGRHVEQAAFRENVARLEAAVGHALDELREIRDRVREAEAGRRPG